MKDDIINQTEEFAKAIHFQNELVMENLLNNSFINKENLNMGKYDNVTMKEYMMKKKELYNDYGRLNITFDEMELNNPDKALEIVMEYKPKVDWSKVEVNTKVLVRKSEISPWCRRHFAKYENGEVYTFPDGLSSFTYNKCMDGCLVNWKYAKLYKGDE